MLGFFRKSDPSSKQETAQQPQPTREEALLKLAQDAHEQGDASQSAHLYLAAFDAAFPADADQPEAESPYVEGLRIAWDDACETGDRSLVEHVFERLAPFSNEDDIAKHAEKLSAMAFQALEHFGLSREELESMSEMIARDLGPGGIAVALRRELPEQPKGESFSRTASKSGNKGTLSAPKLKTLSPKAQPKQSSSEFGDEVPPYAMLVGYDSAIAAMNERGIGLSDDPAFIDFLAMLSRRHGIDAAPRDGVMVFRADAREDAGFFMMSTARELGLPCVRMGVEETPHGFTAMSVLLSPGAGNPNTFARNGFTSEGVLLLEDIDLWAKQTVFDPEGNEVPFEVLMQHGGQSFVNFIRSAVENPLVTVLASCEDADAIHQVFLDALEPLDLIEIALPTDSERAASWRYFAGMFPSLRHQDRDDLVRFSAGLTRADMYTAAREAVEQAWRDSVRERRFVPVTKENLFSKIASFLPLESQEYRELEDAAVELFKGQIDQLEEDLTSGPEA